MVTARVEAHHWTREEYEHLVESGAFDDWNIELVEGVLYDMTPQTSWHAGLATKISTVLRKIDPGNHLVREHSPLSVGGDSVPEPDVAVVPDDPNEDFYTSVHPTSAVLVVEIADSSLRYDREVKARAYSLGGVPEYWIVNLVESQLEVYREPSEDRYASVSVLASSERISPLFAPAASIPVARLLPKLVRQQ